MIRQQRIVRVVVDRAVPDWLRRRVVTSKNGLFQQPDKPRTEEIPPPDGG